MRHKAEDKDGSEVSNKGLQKDITINRQYGKKPPNTTKW